MKNPLFAIRLAPFGVGLGLALIVAATTLVLSGCGRPSADSPTSSPAPIPTPGAAGMVVELKAGQLGAIKIAAVGKQMFAAERKAVGSIDYDEDLAVSVFPPYQGKIIAPLANLGDDVKKDQPLFTIDSPDLVQAEASLIGAAAAFALTSKELARARGLFETNGISERELEQATSDAATAEGALKAARDAMRVFGKTGEEVDRIITARQIDHALVVVSPVAGRITARNAQPGLLAQPGIAPAPYTVADLSNKWMVANVTETDSPLFRVGQKFRASVMAFPGRVFTGSITRMGTAVDPGTHRVMVRMEIADSGNELRPGMLVNFAIEVQPPVESPAIPVNGVVRNADGSLAAWVTRDHQHFERRIVKVGLLSAGQYQVLEGLRLGEEAVTEGAVFLSNILNAPPGD